MIDMSNSSCGGVGRVPINGQDGMAVQQRDNPQAEQAFLDFVEMGHGRSLEKLAVEYQTRTEPVPTKQLSRLKIWSSRYGWQARLGEAISARAEAKLVLAGELDADTFLRTSRHLHRQVAQYGDFPDTVIKIRESVRKPMPKGGAVNVSIRVEVQSIVDRIAEEDGLTEAEKQELQAAVERHLAGAAS